MKKRGISLFVALTMMLSICVPVAADDPLVQKNEIMAEYDGRYDGEKDEYTAPVKANDVVIGSVWDDQSNRGSFTTGEPIEFELCQPENRQGENIRVDLEIPDDDLFYSTIEDDESDRKITLNGNKFTFTPETDAGIIIRVWWSDFDAIGCDEGEYIISYNFERYDMAGEISLDKTPKKSFDFADGAEGKYIFDVGTDVNICFKPDDGRYPEYINFNGTEYSSGGRDGHEHMNTLYDSQNDRYVIPVKDANEYDYFNLYINPNWIDENNRKPVNTYKAFYDERRDDGTITAPIKVGSTTLEDNKEYSFTEGQKLTFKMTPPENDEPIVEIEVFEESYDRANDERIERIVYGNGDGFDKDHKITVTNNQFDFTPATNTYFEVKVWWSEFDKFGAEGDDYTVNVNLDDHTKVEFDKEPKGSMKRTDRNEYRYVFEAGTKVTATFTSDAGYDTGNIDYSFDWEDQHVETHYSVDKYNDDVILLKELYDKDSDSYKLDLSGAKEHCWINLHSSTLNSSNDNMRSIYRVEYDPRCDEQGKPQTPVKVNGEVVSDHTDLEFKAGEKMTFELTPPSDYDETPLFEIELHKSSYNKETGEFKDCQYIGNLETSDQKIELADNKFEYTPDGDYDFIVRIWWSEFDKFGAGENEYTVNVRADEHTQVKFNVKPAASTQRDEREEYKYTFPVGTDVVASIKFEEGYNPGYIDFSYDKDDKRTEEHYSVDKYDTNVKLLTEIYDKNTDTYKLDLSGFGDHNVVDINAGYDPGNPDFMNRIYRVEYDARYDHETDTRALVKINGEEVINSEEMTFTPGQKLSFELVPPTDSNAAPLFEIEVQKDEYDRVTGVKQWAYYGNIDNCSHELALENNKFEFTPDGDNDFVVRVWWSEFDRFGPDGDQYCVRYGQNDKNSGSVSFSKKPVDSITAEDQGTKGLFEIGNDVDVVIKPNDNFDVDFVDYNEIHYCKDPDPEKENEASLWEFYNEEDNSFVFSIENADQENKWFEFYVEFTSASFWSISFDANGGDGEMETLDVMQGRSFTLPDCTFTAPAGKEFDKWDLGKPGDSLVPEADTTVKAVWKDLPATNTPTPVVTETPVPTEAPPTATPTSVPEATETPVPTEAPEATATPVPTVAPEATATATPVPTVAPEATATATPTPAAADSGTDAATPTPTATPAPEAGEPEKVVNVGSAQYAVSKDGTATVNKFKVVNAKKVVIPATIKADGKKYKVTKIAANAFAGMKKLESVKIGKNVKIIGENAFSGCIKLKKLTVPANVKTVKKNAFNGCKKIVLTFKGKTSIKKALSGAKNVTAIVSKKQKTYYKAAFKKSGAKNVTIRFK